MSLLGRHRFACLTAAAAFFLLFAGGMVTSTGSGLAVPDWPLSFGQYFPRMAGGVVFEHGHRMIAGAVGLMTLSLALWIGLAENNPLPRRLAAAAALGIIIQALLGGITVLYSLPKAVSIAHACLGQAVFCVLLALAQVTSAWYEQAKVRVREGLWKGGAALFALTTLQLFFGAVYRHARSGLIWHVLGALAVLAAAGIVCRQTFAEASGERALQVPAWILAAALPVQLILGLGAFLTTVFPAAERTGSAVVPTAHLATGALILGASLVWTLRARRLELK